MKRTIREIAYVSVDNSVLAEINVFFFNGRLLVYEAAKPSIDTNVGGSISTITDMPVSNPRVELNPTSLNDEKDIARTVASIAGRRKRLAYEGDLEAILKSLRIVPSHGT